MFDYLDKLRAKSPATKKQIAFSVSGGATLLVALLWWGSFFGPETAATSEKTMTLAEVISPVQSIFVSLKAAKDMTADGIKKLTQEATASSTTERTSTTSETDLIMNGATMGDMRKAAERNMETYAATTTTTAPSDTSPITTWR